MPETLRAYWQDCEYIVESSNPKVMTLTEALNRWADSSGFESNFFGLIDDSDKAMQFYFEDSIPDDVEDAGHLRIVLVDFPQPELKGSYQKTISIAESSQWIERAFEVGVHHEKFQGLEFETW